MGLQGSLRKLGLADVLQTLLAGRQGNLYLRCGAKRATVHVAAQQLHLCEPDPINPLTMLEGLVQRGLLEQDALTAGAKRRSEPVELVEYLIQEGHLPRPEVDTLLRAAAEDAILDLLTWQKGDFRFEEGEPAPPPAGLLERVPVDVGGVLLRAAQRYDERAEIAAYLGPEASLFLPMGPPPAPENENDCVLEVHALLDDHRVVDEVALLAGIPRFAVLRAAMRCVKGAAARLAGEEELRSEAEARIAVGQTSVARALMLQWAGQVPDDPAPLMSLAELGKLRKSIGEEADALLALGHLHLQRGEPVRALEVFRDLSDHRPGDTRVLSALCAAAEVAGDTELHTRSTIQLAAGALKEDEPQRAAQLLSRVLSGPDAPLAARILHARALVRLRDREGLTIEAEAAAAQLEPRAKTKEEREAAAYFRDAVATLVPERGDLLRQFRSLSSSRSRWQPVALIAALVILVGVAGVVFWPANPAKVLQQAEEAAAAGDFPEALRLIAFLNEKHPDAPETEEAVVLRARIQQRDTPPPPLDPQTAAGTGTEIRALTDRCGAQIPDLPSAEALAALKELATRLSADDATRFRRSIIMELESAILAAISRMERDARDRKDTLAQMQRLAKNGRADQAELSRAVEEATGLLTDDHPARLSEAHRSLESLVLLRPTTAQLKALRGLQSTIDQLKGARERHRPDVSDIRGRVLRYTLDELHQRCRTEASRLLVSGRYEEADQLYAALGAQLAALEDDPDRGTLLQEAQRRGIPSFLSERRSMIGEIREALATARAAESEGELEAAVRAYSALVRRFWHIRFENVIQFPLRVETTPSGARIRLDGKDVGISPTIVHCRWGTQLTLTVEAPGFERATRFIDPGPDIPTSKLHVALEPARRWVVELEPTVASAPIAVNGDLVTVDRTGRVQRLEGKDGRVLWARHIETLEGIRLRPVVAGGLIHLPFIDGTLIMLQVRDGREAGRVRMGRPVGEAAVLDDDVAIAGIDGQLRILRGRANVQSVSLGGPASAGVLAAHGAFWVGTAEGHVLRITPAGESKVVGRSQRKVGVVGLAVDDTGILVTRGDGTLEALTPTGDRRWLVDGLGDTIGSPGAAGGFAAAIDSRGRILLYQMSDGAPRGQVDLRGHAPAGLLGAHDRLVVVLDDGRIWIYDPGTETEVVNVNLGGTAPFGPADLGHGLLAVPSRAHGLTVFQLPEAPDSGK